MSKSRRGERCSSLPGSPQASSGPAPRPLAPPRRAVGLAFYAAKTAETIRHEWPVWVRTEPTRPRPQISAMVGKQKLQSCHRLATETVTLRPRIRAIAFPKRLWGLKPASLCQPLSAVVLRPRLPPGECGAGFGRAPDRAPDLRIVGRYCFMTLMYLPPITLRMAVAPEPSPTSFIVVSPETPS